MGTAIQPLSRPRAGGRPHSACCCSCCASAAAPLLPPLPRGRASSSENSARPSSPPSSWSSCGGQQRGNQVEFQEGGIQLKPRYIAERLGGRRRKRWRAHGLQPLVHAGPAAAQRMPPCPHGQSPRAPHGPAMPFPLSHKQPHPRELLLVRRPLAGGRDRHAQALPHVRLLAGQHGRKVQGGAAVRCGLHLKVDGHCKGGVGWVVWGAGWGGEAAVWVAKWMKCLAATAVTTSGQQRRQRRQQQRQASSAVNDTHSPGAHPRRWPAAPPSCAGAARGSQPPAPGPARGGGEGIGGSKGSLVRGGCSRGGGRRVARQVVGNRSSTASPQCPPPGTAACSRASAGNRPVSCWQAHAMHPKQPATPAHRRQQFIIGPQVHHNQHLAVARGIHLLCIIRRGGAGVWWARAALLHVHAWRLGPPHRLPLQCAHSTPALWRQGTPHGSQRQAAGRRPWREACGAAAGAAGQPGRHPARQRTRLGACGRLEVAQDLEVARPQLLTLHSERGAALVRQDVLPGRV